MKIKIARIIIIQYNIIIRNNLNKMTAKIAKKKTTKDIYCGICQRVFILPRNYKGKNSMCKLCRGKNVKLSDYEKKKQNLMNTLNNAEVDGHGWSYLYTSIYENHYNQGYDSDGDGDDGEFGVTYEIQRFKKDQIKYRRDKIYFNCIQRLDQKLNGTDYHYSEEWYNSNPQGTFTHEWSLCLYNSYGYDYECSNSYETFKNDFIPISIKEAMEKPWGKDIIRKPYRNGLYRFILLRIYILRYIRHLRHIIWMPGSKAYKLLKYQFYERHKMNQIK